MNDDTEAMLAANRAFYRFFAERDVDALVALWSRAVPVACIHPGWDALHGYDAVVDSWRRIMAGPESPDIQCANETPFVAGDLGYVVCHEVIDHNVLVATNMFHREGGDWKLIHHQAGPVAVTAAGPSSQGSDRIH